ncbi:MAG: hypothetical protein K0R40_2279 [Burkholderiales bacterium]|nr:hypothetical protein [Burkholderiales bacterium]
MELTELRIFKAVAEHGGVTRAAAALNRVQSNVTTRVKRLELRLGARLFHRQGRKLVLSAEGKVLLDYAERLLRLSAEAQAALKTGAPRGVLRIGALESTAATRLPALLARYHRDHPAVQLELVTGTTGALVEKVLREEIEAAFVAEPPPVPGLQTCPAFSEQLVLISPRGEARIAGPPIAAGSKPGSAGRASRRSGSWSTARTTPSSPARPPAAASPSCRNRYCARAASRRSSRCTHCRRRWRK